MTANLPRHFFSAHTDTVFKFRTQPFAGNICIYCPGGPDSDFEYSTQSYTGYEPTSMRAIRARYNPYVQTIGRVKQLAELGHNVDKVLLNIHLGPW